MSTPISGARVGLLLGILTATSGLGLAAAPIVLDDIADAFGVRTSATAWVLAATSLTLAVTTPLFGRIADLRGLRSVLRIGTALTIVGAVGVLLAPTFGTLIAARLVQGAGAAALSLTAFSTTAAVVAPAGRRQALGALTALSALTLGAGPLIGAAVGELAMWRWTLALPLLGVLGCPAAYRLAPSTAAGRGQLDVVGAALVMVTASAGLALLQARSTEMPPVAVVLTAVAGAVALVAAHRHVRRYPTGFLPAALLGNRAFLRLSAMGGLIFGGYLGMTFAAPLLLSEARDWSPVEIGLALLPAAVVAAATAKAIDGFADRLGGQRVLAIFAALSGLTLAVAAAGSTQPPLVVLGAAGAVCGFAAAQVVVLAAIPVLVDEAIASVAIGVFNYLFVLGGAIGTALAGALADVASLQVAVAALALGPLAAAGLAAAASVIPRTSIPEPAA